MDYFAGEADVLVIGAGHAGIEAALAAARLGCRTLVFTINMDWVGNLPCNPSIGGTAKGHLVCEIDALGGEMGRAADAATIQSRMLNRGKGPAVHSLRAQIDRRAYSGYMKYALERQENLLVKQAEVVDLQRDGDGWRILTHLGAIYRAKTVVIATGTFLGGRIYVGECSFASGPDGMFAATRLGEAVRALGLPIRRFKTGTPARVLRRSIEFSALEVQPGDEPAVPFSFDTQTPPENKVVCHISWTNERTKEIILNNLDRSPLFSGRIEGVGPRYCPSIEDKVVRFADKERHQLFLEPCGLETDEIYLQGMSSSLPEDVQIAFYRTIPGLERVELTRNAYAIEYDCVDPLALDGSLEAKDFPGLYGAGQFNGSSGYEEAAAQGLIAGINAARRVQGKEPYVPSRADSYIGTLIDDLVTKGCSDPYRMMTSRSEYRLVLRQDNAAERLLPVGYELGLNSRKRLERLQAQLEAKRAELERVSRCVLTGGEQLNRILTERGTSPITGGARLSELLRRPQLSYDALAPVDTGRPASLSRRTMEQVETELKYEGYIARQMAQIRELQRLENRRLPANVDYASITGLRLEAREKLQRVAPRSIGQAGRISGVSPADLSVLLIWLEKQSHAQ